MFLVALGPAEHVSNSSSVGRVSGPHGIPVSAVRLRQDLFRPPWPQPVRTSQTSRALQGPLLGHPCHPQAQKESGCGCFKLGGGVWDVDISFVELRLIESSAAAWWA